MRRTLKAARVVALLLALAACSKQAPVGPAPAAPTAEQLRRGETLARIGNCAACHTLRGGEPYAGGVEIPTPFGRLFAPNITPDPVQGIGRWSADDFWRAMHEGRSRNGDLLYPAFPYTNYTKVTREDSDAIHAYLMSLQPAPRQNRAHELRFPYNQRPLLAVWRALYFEPGEHQHNARESDAWNRGAYLVEGLGHCNACHATRNALGAVAGQGDVAGGLIPQQNWYAPSLASGRDSAIGEWPVDEIVDLLRTGVSRRGAVFGPMAAVVQHSLQHAPVSDLTAMAVYLKAKGGEASKAGPPADTPARSPVQVAAGEKIYQDHCRDCHGDDGRGVERVYPPLAGNPSITMANAVNPIRMVLNGGFPPSTQGNPRPYGMPPFYQSLNDDDVAAVVTYIRQAWGNAAPAATPLEVQRSRGVPVD